jgi:hypothetical protein
MDGNSWNKMKNLYLTIQIGLHKAPYRWDDELEKGWDLLKKDFFDFLQLDMKKNP